MPNQAPFRIGINMAGAVSAGAYTAGVLDFFIQAADEWYAAKQRGENVPGHDVLLEVLSGASAGGMCAAIAATALQETFNHVTATNTPRSNGNKLYNSWVATIDITHLLGQEDFQSNDTVVSLLDCSILPVIASNAIAPGVPVVRPWVSSRLNLFLTLTNLRGVPYRVDQTADSTGEQMLYHADQMQFEVSRTAAVGPTSALPLPYPPPQTIEGTNWKTLHTCAMATGAFPIALAPRILSRTSDDYARRDWTVRFPILPQFENGIPVPPDVKPDYMEWVSENEKIPPVIPDGVTTFENVYVDGGMTNNNPFECARKFLAGAREHNPREPEKADAAVITVAPFPVHDKFDTKYDAHAQSALLKLVAPLIDALVSQSRFQGEELTLAQDPNVASRFMIAPVDEPPGQPPIDPPLQCGSLSAFGGFISREFRDRDYQLGRHNCQRFLMAHFVLPEDNLILAAGLPTDPQKRAAIMDRFSVPPPAGANDNKRRLPISPLCGAASPTDHKVPYPARQYPPDSLYDNVADLAKERIRQLVPRLVQFGFVARAAYWAGFALFGGRLRDTIRDYLRQQTAEAKTKDRTA